MTKSDRKCPTDSCPMYGAWTNLRLPELSQGDGPHDLRATATSPRLQRQRLRGAANQYGSLAMSATGTIGFDASRSESPARPLNGPLRRVTARANASRTQPRTGRATPARLLILKHGPIA
jgi:hypothetical protein